MVKTVNVNIAGICVFLLYLLSPSSPVCAYTVDDSIGLGRRFDGIGGLSGGGATSKLLVNYPEKQRNEILDYLFKPNFAASLQILKVEIGGDAQSTDGTESSHMHSANDQNYHRGYEWWLMKEAKKRNPDIALYGLPWAWPGWIRDHSGGPYDNPRVTAQYIINWILGAKKYHDLDIDYVGIWNEREYNLTYIITLRHMLNEAGLSRVQIVASDGDWDIAEDILKYVGVNEAVDVIGVHYPGTTTTNDAVKTNKSLWSSEDYSTFNDNVGAGCWARILNQNYVNGYMTSTISWNLIAAYYMDFPFGRDGLMTSMEPWSGHYVVESPIWITAHTTQFTSIGWQYLKHGSGVGKLDHGGSFVSLISPDKQHFTMVIETMSHDHSICIRPSLPEYNTTKQTASFQFEGSLGKISHLNVWMSSLGFDGHPTTLMKKIQSIQVVNGAFTLDLDIDTILTLTTSDAGQKGVYSDPPSSKPFPVPYKDNYDSYTEYSEAYNFPPQVGVFEIRDSKDVSHGMVNVQVVPLKPIYWCLSQSPKPIVLGGNHNWTDVSMSVETFVPMHSGANGTFLAVRVNNGGCEAATSLGIFFFVDVVNQKYYLTSDILRKNITKMGNIPVKPSKWFTLRLKTQGNQVQGSIDGQVIVDTPVKSASLHGFVGYGVIGYGEAWFDNFYISHAEINQKEQLVEEECNCI